jgi:hypothetical protein
MATIKQKLVSAQKYAHYKAAAKANDFSESVVFTADGYMIAKGTVYKLNTEDITHAITPEYITGIDSHILDKVQAGSTLYIDGT